MTAVLRIFGWSFTVTIAGIVGALILGGPDVAAIVAILAVLEISLSFDNAVVNATILQRMNPYWQKLFLTVGVLIAVFGMRLIFPLVIVGVSASLGPLKVIDLALNNPDEYARRLTDSHAEIASFGGLFLLMIFLDFLFEEREISWIAPLERATARLGRLANASSIVAATVLILAAELIAPAKEEGGVLLSGLAGLVTYLLVGALSELFETDAEAIADKDADGVPDAVQSGVVLAAGKAAFFLFLYLEVLDASFSFDGVVGAFAISNDIFVIATGLGIGAMYIRSLTVYLVRSASTPTWSTVRITRSVPWPCCCW
jgi:hypothetical protein